jgi:hypothetical protein
LGTRSGVDRLDPETHFTTADGLAFGELQTTFQYNLGWTSFSSGSVAPGASHSSLADWARFRSTYASRQCGNWRSRLRTTACSRRSWRPVSQASRALSLSLYGRVGTIKSRNARTCNRSKKLTTCLSAGNSQTHYPCQAASYCIWQTKTRSPRA